MLACMAAPSERYLGRQTWSVDDLKALKSGKKIWGACSLRDIKRGIVEAATYFSQLNWTRATLEKAASGSVAVEIPLPRAA